MGIAIGVLGIVGALAFGGGVAAAAQASEMRGKVAGPDQSSSQARRVADPKKKNGGAKSGQRGAGPKAVTGTRGPSGQFGVRGGAGVRTGTRGPSGQFGVRGGGGPKAITGTRGPSGQFGVRGGTGVRTGTRGPTQFGTRGGVRTGVRGGGIRTGTRGPGFGATRGAGRGGPRIWVPAPGQDWFDEPPVVIERAPAKPPVSTGVAQPQFDKLFDNGNVYAVQNQPTQETVFTVKEQVYVARITTYHWNNGRGAPAGKIALRNSAGEIVGPWQAVGRPGQGGVPSAYWVAEPDMMLPAGTYTVLDSDPATWAQNAASGGTGMVTIEGAVE
jgi:hypothetical protein